MTDQPVEIFDLPGGEKTSLELTDAMIQERADGTTGFVDGLTASLGYDNSLRFGVKVQTTQTFVLDGVFVTVPFDETVFDFGGFWSSAANGRITIPPGGDGIYSVHGISDFEANATGRRQMRFLKNNTTEEIRFRDGNVSASGETTVELYTLMDLAEGDFLTLQLGENTGGALNCGVIFPIQLSCFMWRFD